MYLLSGSFIAELGELKKDPKSEKMKIHHYYYRIMQTPYSVPPPLTHIATDLELNRSLRDGIRNDSIWRRRKGKKVRQTIALQPHMKFPCPFCCEIAAEPS